MRNYVSSTSIAILAFAFPMAALAQFTIAPTSQSIFNAGDAATYILTVTNPTASTQVFVPSVGGSVNPAWGVQLPASVTVPAGGSQNFNLVLTSYLGQADGTYPFTVTVITAGTLAFTVAGTFIINSTSQSTAEIDTLGTTSVTQQVNTYQVELKARMQGGAYLFDQTYNVAFTDPTFAAHITQAKSVLTGAGAVTFSGPTQLSGTQSLVSSVTNTVQNGSQLTGTQSGSYQYVAPTTGPLTIYTGNRGICQSYAFPPNAPPQLTGCSLPGTPLTFGPSIISVVNTVIPAYTNFTLTVNLVTIGQIATTTNTYLISQVYEIDGYPAGVTPPTTPAPASLVLTLLGLAGCAFYLARQRRASA
jgi:hypothetical protein